MTTTNIQWYVFFIFILSFLLAVVLISVTYIKSEIYFDSALTILKKLLIVYSIPLAIIISGIYGQQQQPLKKSLTKTAFWITVLLSIIWNLFFVGRFGMLVFLQNDSIGDVVAYLDTIPPLINFMVAGGLSYFFIKERMEG